MSPDPTLVARLTRHGQEHLLRWWADLDDDRAGPAASPRSTAIDFDQLDDADRRPGRARTRRPPRLPSGSGRSRWSGCPQTDGERVARRHVAEVGAAALAAGEVAVVLVAGGSGTRLGFDGPKGTFPIGPVSAASLFQIHAEKIVALGRRHGRPLPLYVMTSPENHEATVALLRRARPTSASTTSGSSSRGRCRPSTARRARSCWPRRTTSPSAPTATAARSTALAAPGPDGGAELPRRDARAGHPDALLLPGRQPAGPDRRPGVPRPAPPGRRRDVVQGDREAHPRREARRGRHASTAVRR